MDLDPHTSPDGSRHLGYVLSMSRDEYLALRRVVLLSERPLGGKDGLLDQAERMYAYRHRAIRFPTPEQAASTHLSAG